MHSRVYYRNPEQLFEPTLNVRLGSAYLKRLLDVYDGNRILATADRIPTVNPADPTEVLAQVCQAGLAEVDAAIAAADAAFAAWRDRTPRERAEVLLRAAAIARRAIFWWRLRCCGSCCARPLSGAMYTPLAEMKKPA